MKPTTFYAIVRKGYVQHSGEQALLYKNRRTALNNCIEGNQEKVIKVRVFAADEATQ